MSLYAFVQKGNTFSENNTNRYERHIFIHIKARYTEPEHEGEREFSSWNILVNEQSSVIDTYV